MCCFLRTVTKKLKALLRGTFLRRIFFFASVDGFVHLTSGFFDEKAVYLHSSHTFPIFNRSFTLVLRLPRSWTVNIPDFGSSCKVQQNKFILAEVALRFWNKYENFWMWSILPLHTGQSNFWALEQALVQLRQPRLNTPFIYQFFNCRTGLIVQRPYSTSCHFGIFPLWRKLRWASTPRRTRETF